MGGDWRESKRTMLLKLVRRAAALAVVKPRHFTTHANGPFSGSGRRFYSGGDGQPQQKQHSVVMQMIQYALTHARSQKSVDSYADAMLVLEQGVTNLTSSGGGIGDDGVGMLLLAIATLLHERGDVCGAAEKLRMVGEMSGHGHTSLGLQVGALEGLVGLSLETGQDDNSLVIANECLQLARSRQKEDKPVSDDVLSLRSRGIKGLVDIVLGDVKSAELNFGGLERSGSDGNLLFSCGEFQHCTGDLTSAKDLYERAISVLGGNVNSESAFLSTANMVPDKVLVGATCALGQLQGKSGEFQQAEELLTKALTRAEEYYGLNHPKVGVILTCTAIMYGQKARHECSSSLLIQEGLYRRALDLLKAPAFDSEESEIEVPGRDIVALARGGYAEILSVQQNRKNEGEKLRNWAEKAWRNRRLSLAEALEFTEPSKTAIIDTRISRVL